jgi:hypothetical protein
LSTPESLLPVECRPTKWLITIEEDLAMGGIERGELVPHVESLSSKMLPRHIAEYELVSHW